MKTLIATVITSAICAALSPAASAATVQQEENTNAAGICEAAFSDQTVRNRPTGVRNTGSSAIYITCSAPGFYSGYDVGETLSVYIRVANFGTSTADIGCKLQTGWTDGVTNTTRQGAFSKTLTLAPGTYDWLEYKASDYPSTTNGFDNVNFTCLLQPNMEVQYFGRDMYVDIGT